MADVFISYKREDRDWAERVDRALRDAGFTTWWDTSLVAGEHFNEAIHRELQNANCVVVIWSERARQSQWVNAEAVAGFDRGILVSSRVDGVALGYPFSVVQTTDLRIDGANGIIEGARRIVGVSAASPAKAPPIDTDAKIDWFDRQRNGWYVLGGGAAFIVLLLAANSQNASWFYAPIFELFLGAPAISAIGSLLVASGVARRPITEIWMRTILLAALSGAAGATVPAYMLTYVYIGSVGQTLFEALVRFSWFALPVLCSGLGAHAAGLWARRRWG